MSTLEIILIIISIDERIKMKNEICYYCNLSTFKSIISNQTFWLSDIHFMNDSSEETLFLKVLSQVMKEKYNLLSSDTKEYLEKNQFIKGFFTHIEQNYKNLVYVCCFSDEINDDLSQWRGYADDGKGLCIGFNKEIIKKLSTDSDTIKSELISKVKTTDNISIGKVFAQKEIEYTCEDDIIKELRSKIAPIIDQYDTDDKYDYSSKLPDIKLTQELYKKPLGIKDFIKINLSNQRTNIDCVFSMLCMRKLLEKLMIIL